MIHYHGLPITPQSAALAAVGGGHAFVSFRYPGQLGLVLDACQSFAIDNGAFSAWKSGDPVTEWRGYYEWVAELHRYPNFDFAVIPDVIDGDEDANDDLLNAWPWREIAPWVGAPVWHMHESIARLQRIANSWPRICIGSSGQFSTVGNDHWWRRIREAMNSICDGDGRPICKVHGLRMLNPKVFTRLPLASADSTNIARNIGIDSAWRGTYTPASKDSRARVMRERIEAHQSITFLNRVPEQTGLFDDQSDHRERTEMTNTTNSPQQLFPLAMDSIKLAELKLELPALIEQARAEEREACATLLRISNDELRLMAGEMTNQELRTVRAVLSGLFAAIRARSGKQG